jgi:hypothetical protein
LLIVGVACSDDDDTDQLSYCEALALLADEGAAIGPEADRGAVESALDLWEQVALTAPTDVADAARLMADTAEVVAREGTDAEVDLDSLAQASAELAASAAETCDIDLTSDESS